MNIQNFIVLGTIFVLLGAPAIAQVEKEEAGSDRVCVSSRLIDNFDALTDKYVYVEARSDQYLFTMRRRCNGLHFSNGIALKNATSRICSDGFGEIVYRDMDRLVSCGIDDIQVVESKEDAQAIVAQLEKDDE